ncbi:MAG: CDP-alcohol phosphatidyltransferase family protein [Planctomycetota bacterium]
MNDGAKENTVAMTDRRPIRSRSLGVVQRFGALLVRIGIGPNTISLSSMGFALAGAAYMVAASYADGAAFRTFCMTAAACIQLRLIANLMDGVVAEIGGQVSRSGRLFNEWPDRVSDLLLLIGFGSLVIEPGGWWLGVLAGCGAVLTAYCRELGRAVGAPMSFVGPMAKPQRMAVLTAVLFVIAAWPGTGTSAFWGPDQAWGLPALTLLVITISCVVTSIRRLTFYHRFVANQDLRGDA